MLLEELSKIAAQSGNCRLVISYNGDDKYALGVSDGVTICASQLTISWRDPDIINPAIQEPIPR